jgi:hypothetical protein
MEPARFPFADIDPAFPGSSLMPLLPLTLTHGENVVSAEGMLDTGAAVNVLPYSLGLQLGFVWEDQRTSITLSGNLAQLPARGVVVSATIAPFSAVRLAFAWTRSDNVRLLLGQANFFMEFDVCFFRAQSQFEVTPKAG